MIIEIAGYRIAIEDAAATIRKQGYARIAVQVPEGLKRSVVALVEYLQKETGAVVFVSADPCFGACDLVNYELKDFVVECVVHIGHTAISDGKTFGIPTLFVNAYSTLDVSDVVLKAIPFLEGKKIGVVTTAQHLHTLDQVESILKSHRLEPLLLEGDERISANGQILGCNFSVASQNKKEVDSFLFVGSGTFHPVGLLMSTNKPVIAADPYMNQVKKKELDDMKDSFLRQRYGAICSCRNAKRFGILIGVKQGQQRIKLAYEIKEMLDAADKKSLLITMGEFSPVCLQGFADIDCYVSTACPRIAIDDFIQYKKPIITPVELEIVLGRRAWEDYRFDEISG